MTTSERDLNTRLSATFTAGGATSDRPWLWRPLLALIATGRPVGIDEIAAAAGRTDDEIRAALTAMPDTEYDEHGRVVGAGLTQRATGHRFEIDDHILYTWCALDTLAFPAVLDRPARVTSACHATGAPIQLIVTPNGVTAMDPDTAVVSVVTPDAPDSIRAAFCNHVHFFATADAAQPWLDQHPDATVLPVADAYQLGKPLIAAMLDDNTPPACNC